MKGRQIAILENGLKMVINFIKFLLKIIKQQASTEQIIRFNHILGLRAEDNAIRHCAQLYVNVHIENMYKVWGS